MGGFVGATGVDLMRGVLHADGPAFLAVFVGEAAVFLAAAILAARVDAPERRETPAAAAMALETPIMEAARG